MKARLLALTLAAFVIPATATAGTVTLLDWVKTPADHFTANALLGGGPFKATTVGGDLGNTSFLTFCLEFNEHVTLDKTFDYELSDYAKLGGVSGQTGPLGDPVSDATKWLYYQALSTNYVPLITGIAGVGNLNKSGRYIQEAIWFLEGERTFVPQQILQYSYDVAQAALLAAAANEWTLLEQQGHRVYAMNLTVTKVNNKGVETETVHQDQLAYRRIDLNPLVVPEPSTLAQLVTLGPVGLFGYLAVGAWRLGRRRRR